MAQPPRGPPGPLPPPGAPPVVQQNAGIHPLQGNLQVIGQGHVLRNLPQFKHGTDLPMFLKRFNIYCEGLQIRDDRTKVSILINCLDDAAMRGIVRHLEENPTFDELVTHLKEAEGYLDHLVENYRIEMRNKKRLRTERIRDWFNELSRLGELAYPDPNNRQERENAIRTDFIKGINNPAIAARLRENYNLTLEELLKLATLLEDCFEASKTDVVRDEQ